MKTKLEQLRDIIIKAVPSILDLKFGCKVDYNECPELYKNGDPPDWVEAEMICFNNEFHQEICIIQDGTIYNNVKLEDYRIIGRDITLEDVLIALHKNELSKRGMRLYLPNIAYKVIDNGWKLGKPLKEQSEETKNYLLEVLK